MKGKAMALRWRMTAATTMLGATLSILFAAATVFITEDYERLLVTEMLSSEAQDYGLSLATNPQAVLPQSHRLSGYLRRRDGSGQVPPEFVALAPGVHEEEAGLPEGVTVGVFDVAQGRLFLVVDLGDIEVLELHLNYFLIAIIVLGTALAAWLGWFLAGLSLRPVRQLAAAVDGLPTAPQPSNLSEFVANDELGRLAGAIDRYQQRLVDADTEERRFFADASHELRTPIAVILGVTEVILDDPEIRSEQRRWFSRLDRGMVQLTLLLDVLLGLARGRNRILETVPIETLVTEALAANEDLAPRALATTLVLRGTWDLPRAEARLVLQAVLRRLTGTSGGGNLTVTNTEHEIDLTYSASDVDETALQSNERGDIGVGTTLVNRLAAQLDWTIEYGLRDQCIREASIRRLQGS